MQIKHQQKKLLTTALGATSVTGAASKATTLSTQPQYRDSNEAVLRIQIRIFNLDPDPDSTMNFTEKNTGARRLCLAF